MLVSAGTDGEVRLWNVGQGSVGVLLIGFGGSSLPSCMTGKVARTGANTGAGMTNEVDV